LKDAWPRATLDEDRADMFRALYGEGAEVEPIEAIPRGDGTFLVADGVHRVRGAAAAGCTEIDAVLLSRDSDESLADFVFRRGLETANRSALPLTKSERQRATLRVLEWHPEMSHRAVARLVGVSHDTIDRWAAGVADSATESSRGAHRPTPPRPDEVARRLTTYFIRLDEGRGILDQLVPQRMGRHLADAFEHRLGEDALSQARRFAQWTTAAVRVLEERCD
jgi:ParB-like chromosome segregation protein Spo0J